MNKNYKNHHCSRWFLDHILNSIFCFPFFCFNDCFFKTSRLSAFWQWWFLSISNLLDYGFFDQKYTTQKALFLKGKKNWKSAGGGRNRPERFLMGFGHHYRNIWHLSIKKFWSVHRFWKKYWQVTVVRLFPDTTVFSKTSNWNFKNF